MSGEIVRQAALRSRVGLIAPFGISAVDGICRHVAFLGSIFRVGCLGSAPDRAQLRGVTRDAL